MAHTRGPPPKGGGGGGGPPRYGPYEEAPPEGGRYLDLFHAGFKYMKG